MLKKSPYNISFLSFTDEFSKKVWVAAFSVENSALLSFKVLDKVYVALKTSNKRRYSVTTIYQTQILNFDNVIQKIPILKLSDWLLRAVKNQDLLLFRKLKR